jgi:asparagine synthase (glutamine-hydrolysing)
MCGINGIFAYGNSAPVVDGAELIRTREQMAARGPDGAGEWHSDDRRVGFGHRRLAIIDPRPEGAQPMGTADGRLWITFNGEIYNYEALRNQLIAEGVVFRTHSDTEVLLYLYMRDGADMVRRLRGMFAFAIWDGKERAMFLARDPHGIKPLYYTEQRGVFRFASQVKALLAGGAVSRELEPAGVTGFLHWGSVPEPFTLYRDIRALPAGSTLRVSSLGVETPHRYWDLATVVARSMEAASEIPAGSEGEFLRSALLGSVRAHLVADVPVGAFLSAGLDSSTIVGLARELRSAPIETITLTSEEFRGSRNDEAPIAVEIARHLDVHHHLRTMSVREFESDLPAILAAMDQPTIDGLNTWFVSKAAAETGLKVALSGLGGDELLGGYPTFASIPRMVQRWSALNGIPAAGRLFCSAYSGLSKHYQRANPKYAGLLRYGGTYRGAYMIERGVVKPWELDHVLDREFVRAGLARLGEVGNELDGAAGTGLNGFAKVSILESTRYMRNQLLRDSDWAGMAHSLEIRVPLVDSVLTEQLAGLAATGRFQFGKSALLRTLPQGLPSSATSRPKTGFTVPLWQWLRKSAATTDWKRVEFLRRPNVHDYSRWAYTLLSITPDTASLLKGSRAVAQPAEGAR